MKTKRHWPIALLLCLTLLLSGCTMIESEVDEANIETIADLATLPKNPQGFVDISVAQLAQLMPEKDFTLVNVHIPDQGDLPETDLSIPYLEIEQFVAALPDKTANIVLYCRSGGMSSYTAAVLAEMGYENLYELDGGFNAWRSAGYELLQVQ